MSISLNMLMLLICLHVAACLWFLLGSLDSTDNWVDNAGLRNEDTLTQYLTSMHWCLAQITPAPMNIQPQNLKERSFNVLLILVTILAFSTIMSSVTASMTRLRAIHYTRFQQWSLLERFLQQNQISSMLSIRLTQFLEGAMARQSIKVQKENVVLLKLLSHPLNLELHSEYFKPLVCRHPFFQGLSDFPRSFSEVCLNAIQSQLLSKQDVLFEPGSLGPCMYFQTAGVLFYQRPDGTRWDASRPEQHEINRIAIRWVKEKQWFCEGSLWVKWVHAGKMSAWTESEVLSVESSKFRQIVTRAGSNNHCAARAKQWVADQASLVRGHGFVWDIPPEISLSVYEPLPHDTEALEFIESSDMCAIPTSEEYAPWM